MGHPAAVIVAMALLCASASGLSQDPLDFIPQAGAPPSAERLRQGTVLDDYMMHGNLSCEATCNTQAYSDGDCQGAFKAKCHGSHGHPGHNATFVALLLCNGHWTEDGRNGTSTASNPTGVAIACNGVFHEKVLALGHAHNESVFGVMDYGCAFMFSYEATALGDARVVSHTCHGAETIKSVSGAHDGGGDVTQAAMEAILEDVAPDDGATAAGDDAGVGLQPLAGRRNASITCNGQEASARQPCHGTLQITLEGPNATVAEMCRGWWIPAPGERLVFACTGDWTVGLSKAGRHSLEMDSSCVGHAALARDAMSSHGHHFRGSREVCIGRADVSVQLPGPHPERGVDAAVTVV